MNHNLFNQIKRRTNVNINDIIRLSQRLNAASFKDEKTVRRVIAQVAQLANVRLSKQKEDQLVRAILNNQFPKDINDLAKMLK